MRRRGTPADLTLARQRLEDRDYRSALSAANDASQSARMAIENTGPAKSAARNAAEMLDFVEPLLAELPDAHKYFTPETAGLRDRARERLKSCPGQ